jgi:hypothetical protein
LSALCPAAPAESAGARRAAHAIAETKMGARASRRGTSTSQAAQTREDLATRIARRVAVIDKGDPDRRRKAFRVFLESLMLDEWGAQLLNDPGFHQLVDTVQAQMESNAELRSLMNEASERLLGPHAT